MSQGEEDVGGELMGEAEGAGGEGETAGDIEMTAAVPLAAVVSPAVSSISLSLPIVVLMLLLAAVLALITVDADCAVEVEGSEPLLSLGDSTETTSKVDSEGATSATMASGWSMAFMNSLSARAWFLWLTSHHGLVFAHWRLLVPHKTLLSRRLRETIGATV